MFLLAIFKACRCVSHVLNVFFGASHCFYWPSWKHFGVFVGHPRRVLQFLLAVFEATRCFSHLFLTVLLAVSKWEEVRVTLWTILVVLHSVSPLI